MKSMELGAVSSSWGAVSDDDEDNDDDDEIRESRMIPLVPFSLVPLMWREEGRQVFFVSLCSSLSSLLS